MRAAPPGVVRVGLIGLGSMGRNHLRVLTGRPDVAVVAVADPDTRAVRSVTAAVSADGHVDPRALLDRGDIDAVMVVAPTTAHRELVLNAIDRNIPVFVEKPLAPSIDDCLAIVAAARLRGVPVQVGHIERFNPAVRALQECLRHGWLGAVYSVSARRAGPFPARIRDVGVTIDLATHDVDLLSWLVGTRPTRVYGETARRVHAEHEDMLFGLLTFPSGVVGLVDVNWLTPTKRRWLTVVGEEGMFELDYLTQRLAFTRHPDIDRPRLIKGYAPTFVGHVADVPVETAEPLAAELESFLRVVRGEIEPEVNAEDGLWAVAIARALLESATHGAPVHLEGLLSEARAE